MSGALVDLSPARIDIAVSCTRVVLDMTSSPSGGAALCPSARRDDMAAQLRRWARQVIRRPSAVAEVFFTFLFPFLPYSFFFQNFVHNLFVSQFYVHNFCFSKVLSLKFFSKVSWKFSFKIVNCHSNSSCINLWYKFAIFAYIKS